MHRALVVLFHLTLFPSYLFSQLPSTESALADTLRLYGTDRDAVLRRHDVDGSADRRERLRGFSREWLARLEGIAYDPLGVEERIDWQLMRNGIQRELAQLELEERRANDMARLVPFADTIAGLMTTRRGLERPDARQTAAVLSALAKSADTLRARSEKAEGRDTTRAGRITALRAIGRLDDLRRTLGRWYNYYAGYDPVFTWWNREPFRGADSALVRYARALRTNVLGQKQGEDEPIIGDPIGDEALRKELVYEMIAYTPDELIAIAEREFAWADAEMLKASRELGYGDDWHAAMEHVKNTYVEPGEQPYLIRDLAQEAIEYVESRGLLTVPPLAKEVWRMEMIPPEQQKVSPFFLGGEVFRVSYPTDVMSTEDKLMSMRGNNPHFSRATAHHELIPGHHLQQFMTARYHTQRREFGTPFWGEGWALYWEMRLWDMGFPRGPEDRIGMLFWRMHRCARIIFSLRFHQGRMTPQEAIDFLVDRVGHERANATAEVRRSFNGSYSPLYQIAYMIGALQFRQLHRDLVVNGSMTERDFHDAVLQGGSTPVELVRARLMGTRLPKEFRAQWRFAGE